MGLEKIGLQGVFETQAFSQGLQKYTSGLATASNQTSSTASKLGTAISAGLAVGMAAFAALAAAALAASIGIGKVLINMVFDAGKLGTTLETLSGQTGISTDRLQELAYAGKLLDVDLETMTSGMRFLTRSMYAAQDGTGDQADAFKTLGLSIYDVNGHLKDSQVMFGETIDALKLIDDPTLRDALVMKLMGRSAMELNPLIDAGSQLLEKYSIQAHTMGAVVGTEGVKALNKFNDRWEALKTTFEAIKASIAIDLLGPFTALETWLENFISQTLVPLIAHFGEFVSLTWGIKTPAQQPTAVPALNTATLTQDQLNYMWFQYWNNNGPRPPAGTQYTGGRGTPPPVGATTTATGSKLTTSQEEAPPFVATPFELAIKNFVEKIFPEFLKNLQAAGDALAKLPWLDIAADFLIIITTLTALIQSPAFKALIAAIQTADITANLLNPSTRGTAMKAIFPNFPIASTTLKEQGDISSKTITDATAGVGDTITTSSQALSKQMDDSGTILSIGFATLATGLVLSIDSLLMSLGLPPLIGYKPPKKAHGGFLPAGQSAIVGDWPGMRTGFEELIRALPGGGVQVYPHSSLSGATQTRNITVNLPMNFSGSSEPAVVRESARQGVLSAFRAIGLE